MKTRTQTATELRDEIDRERKYGKKIGVISFSLLRELENIARNLKNEWEREREIFVKIGNNDKTEYDYPNGGKHSQNKASNRFGILPDKTGKRWNTPFEMCGFEIIEIDEALKIIGEVV